MFQDGKFQIGKGIFFIIFSFFSIFFDPSGWISLIRQSNKEVCVIEHYCLFSDRPFNCTKIFGVIFLRMWY
jgi:hypothetical protein